MFLCFQAHQINVVRIESRLSTRKKSEYEIFVDLEADRNRIEQSMRTLKRQVSCIDFQSKVDYANEENIVQNDGNLSKKTCQDIERTSISDDLSRISPFFDTNGNTINGQSKSPSNDSE